MRYAIHLVLVLACAACSEQHRAPLASSSPPAAPAAAGAGGVNQPASGGTVASGAANDPGASAAAGGEAIAGAAGADATGSVAGSSSAAAGTSAPSDRDPPPPVRATDALIPEPSGDCPELVSGTVTVMGTPVEVFAGAPGATPGPLLLAWHGTGATGADAIRLLPRSVRDEIAAAGGIVFAPNSGDGEVREGSDTGGALGIWFTSDFALADELVACAYKHHGIDPRRIYTTGCAAGAFMASALSLARSSYLAAAVINSGGLATEDAFTLQDPLRVPSVMSTYGTSELIPFSLERMSGFLAGAITAAGGFAVECPFDTAICATPVDVQERAWEFLKAHPFGVAPFPYAAGLPSGFPESCRIRPGG